MTWMHASRLHNLIGSQNAGSKLGDFFNFHYCRTKVPDLSGSFPDVCEPALFKPLAFIERGFAAISRKTGIDLKEKFVEHELFQAFVCTVENQKEVLEIDLWRDLSLADNQLGSFYSHVVDGKFESLERKRNVAEVVGTLLEDPTDLGAWGVLALTAGNLPLYADIREDLIVIIKKLEITGLREMPEPMPGAIISFLASQSLYLPDDVTEHIEKMFLEWADCSKHADPSKEGGSADLVITTLLLSKRTPDGSVNACHLTRLIKKLFQMNSEFKPAFREVLLQLTRRLPLNQSRGFGELLLLVRLE